MHAEIKAAIETYTNNPSRRMDTYTLGILSKLEESKYCEAVWRAIAARLQIAEERSSTHTAGGKVTLAGEFFRLGFSVCEGLKKPIFQDAALASQRADMRARVGAATDTLRGCLEQLASDAGTYPPALERAIDEAGIAAVTSFIADLEEDEIRTGEKKFLLDDNSKKFAEWVSMSVTSEPADMLSAIRRGVQEWSESQPMNHRPEAKNADRLRLIRVLTSHFRRRYGTPLRACTLAVADVFFDCDGLNESDIAKLAP